MSDPFHIEGPALLSISGGRTSARLLRGVLDAHGGQLPKDIHALFANTGKERHETLEFLRDIDHRWGGHLHWVEYVPGEGRGKTMRSVKHREVTYETASREGQPFAAMMDHLAYVPNPSHRLCTMYLKVLTMQSWMMEHTGLSPGEYTEVIGFRADERHRAVNLRAEWPNQLFEFPLVRAEFGKRDVLDWWSAQPFDLALGPNESNCDLCFLKGHATRIAIMQDHPEYSSWWIEQEKRRGHRFRPKGPDYATLDRFARTQVRLPLVEDDPADLGGCNCTD